MILTHGYGLLELANLELPMFLNVHFFFFLCVCVCVDKIHINYVTWQVCHFIQVLLMSLSVSLPVSAPNYYELVWVMNQYALKYFYERYVFPLPFM